MNLKTHIIFAKNRVSNIFILIPQNSEIDKRKHDLNEIWYR